VQNGAERCGCSSLEILLRALGLFLAFWLVFLGATHTPGAMLVKQNGTITFVICHADGATTIEVPVDADDTNDKNRQRSCDFCLKHVQALAANSIQMNFALHVSDQAVLMRRKHLAFIDIHPGILGPRAPPIRA
jgi:hypothetical protein